ncbi:MAG: T9SS type A sorting domain-containing protein [Ignavibacteriales bacterium]|nr:T9SS type A sorting domain-containing protein [Ignavibacteriales bacterium]
MSTKFIAIFFLSPFISYNFQTIVPNNFVKLSNGEIEINIENNGNIILDSHSNSVDTTLYDNLNLYTASLFISGKANDKLKLSNGFGLIRGSYQFKPGKISDSLTKQNLFLVNNDENPFNNSWIEWKKAVELGAEFYDGNLNGVYDPIDRNKNNIWDENEDRPPNLGNQFSWCVYNDLTDRTENYIQSDPLGIEIEQSSFINKKLIFSDLDRLLFVKYRFRNTGVISSQLDSCYLTIASDFDAGIEYNKDLMGCDTLRKNSFIYQAYWDYIKKKEQAVFAFTKILSPPFFNKTNSSESNIIVNQGYLGLDTIVNSQFVNASTIYDRRSGFWPLDEGLHELRNVQIIGGYQQFTILDPCITDTSLYNIEGLSCSMVNPKFMFSGNPVTKYGWTSNWTNDHAVYISYGPFQLVRDKPIDIWVCYSSVKGDSLEDAYNKMLEIDNYAQTFYNYNFFIEPPTPSINNTDLNDYDFYLWNNYPNPFNNSTKIRYNLDRTEHTTLKVFNVLGEEIKTLVSEIQDKGVYEVDFNAENLPSGIYFYRLQQNAFFWTRKMIYLR